MLAGFLNSKANRRSEIAPLLSNLLGHCLGEDFTLTSLQPRFVNGKSLNPSRKQAFAGLVMAVLNSAESRESIARALRQLGKGHAGLFSCLPQPR